MTAAPTNRLPPLLEKKGGHHTLHGDYDELLLTNSTVNTQQHTVIKIEMGQIEEEDMQLASSTCSKPRALWVHGACPLSLTLVVPTCLPGGLCGKVGCKLLEDVGHLLLHEETNEVGGCVEL